MAKRVPPCAIAEARYVPSGHDWYSDAMTSDAGDGDEEQHGKPELEKESGDEVDKRSHF